MIAFFQKASALDLTDGVKSHGYTHALAFPEVLSGLDTFQLNLIGGRLPMSMMYKYFIGKV